MIDTEQTVTIRAPIATVWDFASDIRRWADLMPGMQACEVIDDDNSHWTLKVGVGGMVRAVRVGVHVNRWAGPGEVDFSYQLEGDPVQGGGLYRAVATAEGETQVTLHVRVEGSGPLAPMWEAMGRPLLPQLAKGFANQFRDAIEAGVPGTEPLASAPSSLPARLLAWLAGLWRRIVRG